MKLFYSPNSPYARKCRVVVLEKGLANKVEFVKVDPWDNSPELLQINPLATVPALVTDEGLHLCDSTVICEYLDSLAAENRLYPEDNRICVLAIAALADGIIDAAVATVIETMRRPEDKRWPEWVKRKEIAIERGLEKCAAVAWQTSPLSIGTVSLVVALAYISFRLPHLDWRGKHKQLADWYDVVAKRVSMVETAPVP